jgi:hypothetical protein
MTKTLQEQICELDLRLAKGELWLNNNLTHPQHEEYEQVFWKLLLERNDLENQKISQEKLF